MLFDDSLAEVAREVEVFAQGRIRKLRFQHPECLEVHEVSAIGIQHGPNLDQSIVSDGSVPALGLQLAHADVETLDRRLRGITPERLDVSPQECDAVIVGLQDDLLGMDRQMQLRLQELLQPHDQRFEILPVGMDDIKIVDVTPVMPAMQLALDELVEMIHEDVAEQLRGDVADGQSDVLGGVEQALRRRQTVPVGGTSQDVTSFGGIAEQNDFDQIVDQFAVETVAPPTAVARRTGPVLVQTLHQDAVQDAFVDAHEVTPQVEFENVRLAGVVVGATAQMMLQPLDADQYALALAAGVTVEDHACLEHRRDVIVQQPADDAVGEGRGEDFAFDRHFRDEADGRIGSIRPGDDLIAEFDQIVFEIEFELQLTVGVAFVLSCVEIGPEEIAQ